MGRRLAARSRSLTLLGGHQGPGVRVHIPAQAIMCRVMMLWCGGEDAPGAGQPRRLHSESEPAFEPEPTSNTNGRPAAAGGTVTSASLAA